MDANLIFSAGGSLAMAGWLVLLASPFAPRVADAVATYVIPLLLSVAYAGLILAFWTSAEGGFDSLDNVARLFETRELLLAGWLHYLAFDLFVGAWIVRTSRAAEIPFWLVVPCLPATFLFGPAGYLAFAAIRFARARKVAEPIAV
ncbi:MAG: ABA4-like family protein [Mesorhizobium sp.]